MKIDTRYLIGLILLTISLSLTCAFIVAFVKADKEWLGALIGSLGNIIGGVLGGYIAFAVANYQLNETRLNDNVREKQEAKNLVLVLKEELRNNSIALDAVLQDQVVDPKIIKFNLTREAWGVFSSKVAHLLEENLFITLNTVYRKVQVYESMSIDEISNEVDREQVIRMKSQFDECIRKLDDFRKNLE